MSMQYRDSRYLMGSWLPLSPASRLVAAAAAQHIYLRKVVWLWVQVIDWIWWKMLLLLVPFFLTCRWQSWSLTARQLFFPPFSHGRQTSWTLSAAGHQFSRLINASQSVSSVKVLSRRGEGVRDKNKNDEMNQISCIFCINYPNNQCSRIQLSGIFQS